MFPGKSFNEVNTFLEPPCALCAGLPLVPFPVNLFVSWWGSPILGLFWAVVNLTVINTEFIINLITVLLVAAYNLVV